MQTAVSTKIFDTASSPNALSNVLSFILVAAVMAGCSSSRPAPVVDRKPLNPPAVSVGSTAPTSTTIVVPALDTRPRDPNAKIYVVKPGDSLYGIAFQNGVEYRELAAWNNIENVNKIRVGQELRVNAPTLFAGVSAATPTGTAGLVSVPSIGGTAQSPAPLSASGAQVVAAPLVTTPPPSSVPSGAQELLAAQNAAANQVNANSVPANSATLKVEPKISKQPYSDAAYNRALQQADGAVPTLMAGTNTGIPAPKLPTKIGAASGAQPPLTGLPSVPPSTSTNVNVLAATAPMATLPRVPVPQSAPQILPPPSTPIVAVPQPTPVVPVVTAPAAIAPTLSDANAITSTDMPAWNWPLAMAGKPRITANFTDLNKGIDLAGARGQGVLAAAPGKVVYSGTAMRGYGQLVIVKHNVAWFSAYAHNDKILVAEGDAVKKGQKIAEMGSTDADSVKLHFEIRKQGVPVDPLKFLPAL